MLSCCALGAKVLGALFRIPLTNIIGAAGMGLYQLAFPVYALLLTFCSGGVTVAVSRVTAEKRARGESPKRELLAAGLLALGTSLACGALLFGLAPYVSRAQGNAEATLLLRTISLALPFASGIAFLKGWAQGYLLTVPSGVATLTEQLVKLVVGLALAKYLLPRGVTAAVCGAVAGVVLSEVVALIVTVIAVAICFGHRKRVLNALCEAQPELANAGFSSVLAPPNVERRRQLRAGKSANKERLNPSQNCEEIAGRVPAPSISKSYFKPWLIVTIGVLLIPFSQFIDSVLIINLLVKGGESAGNATVQYGLLSAPVASLVNLPIVVSISLAAVIVPAVARSRAALDLNDVLKKSALAVKLACIVGLPCSFLMCVFAEPILALLYPAIVGAERVLAVKLLRVLCFEILFMSGVQIYTALLQALDRPSVPVQATLAGVIVKIVLTLVLVPRVGIGGSAVSSLMLALVAWAGNAAYVSRYLGVNGKFIKNIAEIMVAGVIMLGVAILLAVLAKNTMLAFALGAPVCAVLYLVLLGVFHALDGEELALLPFVGRLARRRKAKGA